MGVRITFIGAGSTVFARNLMGDILSFPELSDATIVLHDIDEERLAVSEAVGRKIVATLGARAKIESTTDRLVALNQANYVITMFQVGGYEPSTVIDFAIPHKFGLQQTIADTLGIGGIMRGLRTIPVLLDICRDMEKVCPDALLLNYVNPMSILCWAVSQSSPIRTIGLCHSVQHTAQQLAGDVDVPYEEVRYECAGINHMSFYLSFVHATEMGDVDLYPAIRRRGERIPLPMRGEKNRSDGGTSGLSDAVRYEMLKRLGYFVTESSEHFAEYVPWFIKSHQPHLIEEFGIPINEYLQRCQTQIAGWESLQTRLLDPEAQLKVHRSMEYGAGIIHSLETGEQRVVYGNVPNRGLISNLPHDCCVEVACSVDAQGIVPQPVGKLPPQLAALIQTNINVQALTVEAALTGCRDHIYHAAMLDPRTASELNLQQIWELVDELLLAHRDVLPENFYA
ncbi:MAG: alpha-glucosidase/alpha-galactosidase [Ilumatobacteraceae bacterium]|nr:alpha-glucosidase/alpha-galactosidase [Ilumatobacteraceae bacterium]